MKNAGYLFVDHRNSPGIPEDVALRMGLDPALVGEGKVMEADSYRCCGCGGMVMMLPTRTRERAKCYKCNTYMCDACAAHGKTHEHTPFVKVIDEVASGRAKWTYGPEGHAVLTKIGDGNG